ncbi:MAG: nucleotidyltransferase family protein [Caulobacteraceae bacterium]
MTRDDLLKQLRDLKPMLAQRGVEGVALFGSFARDEAGPNSDIDLLVRFSKVPGLAYFDIEEDLSNRLGRHVEMTTEQALPPFIRDAVVAEAIVV